MPSFRQYHPQQEQLFGYVDPDHQLAPDDPCRFVDELVEQLDLSLFESRYSNLGSPGYDPRLHLKVFLLGYMEGMFSSRKLMRCCQRDLAFVFLTRGQVPNFRTIARFRQVHSEDIKVVFEQIVLVAREMGMAKLGRVVIDATTIKANASRSATVQCESIDEELRRLDEYLRQLSENDCSEDQAFGEERSGDDLEGELADERVRRQRMREALDKQRKLTAAKKIAEQKPDASQVNTTDADCVVRRDGATKQLVNGYGCHAATSEDGLILATEVRSESNDCSALIAVLDIVMNNVKDNLTSAEVYADSGYYAVAVIEELERRGIDSLIPESQSIHKLNGIQVAEYHQGLVYDPQTDSFVCSRGEHLGFIAISKETRYGKARQRRIYRNAAACKQCPIARECIKSKHPYREVKVTGHPEKVQQYRAKFDDPINITKYKTFRKSIEKVFGHVKGNQRFRQFLTRGIEQVSGEWALICSAYNIIRMRTELTA
jgi:transposase